MTLTDLLKTSSPDPEAICAHLDALSPQQAAEEVRALSVKLVHRCWEVSGPNGSIDLTHLVPAQTADATPVHHLGVNTLPMSRQFEKRFVRSPQDSGELWGYNHQPLAWLTGPGYFVVHDRGADGEDVLFIDYRSFPSGDITDWPARRGNDSGIAKLVYGGMQDFMRRVSSRVSVGRAYVGGKDRKASFMLVRV